VAALKRAATEPGIAVSASDLDQHRYLLNCLNGVVDLRTGELLPAERHYLITKLCHYRYSPDARCPRFLKFINWAMGETDAAECERVARLVGFLQKVLGYSLTGDVSEKAAFVCYGKKGNNGKTTLLTIFSTILAEYATQLDINTLMTSKMVLLAGAGSATKDANAARPRSPQRHVGRDSAARKRLYEIKKQGVLESVVRWNASVQHRLSANWVFSVVSGFQVDLGPKGATRAAESSELIRQALFSESVWKPATVFHLALVVTSKAPTNNEPRRRRDCM